MDIIIIIIESVFISWKNTFHSTYMLKSPNHQKCSSCIFTMGAAIHPIHVSNPPPQVTGYTTMTM